MCLLSPPGTWKSPEVQRSCSLCRLRNREVLMGTSIESVRNQSQSSLASDWTWPPLHKMKQSLNWVFGPVPVPSSWASVQVQSSKAGGKNNSRLSRPTKRRRRSRIARLLSFIIVDVKRHNIFPDAEPHFRCLLENVLTHIQLKINTFIVIAQKVSILENDLIR